MFPRSSYGRRFSKAVLLHATAALVNVAIPGVDKPTQSSPRPGHRTVEPSQELEQAGYSVDGSDATTISPSDRDPRLGVAGVVDDHQVPDDLIAPSACHTSEYVSVGAVSLRSAEVPSYPMYSYVMTSA